MFGEHTDKSVWDHMFFRVLYVVSANKTTKYQKANKKSEEKGTLLASTSQHGTELQI